MSTPRAKAISKLLVFCRHAQRSRDLHEKLAFVELEIELTALQKAEEAQGNVLPMAANFAQRDEDPGEAGKQNGGGK